MPIDLGSWRSLTLLLIQLVFLAANIYTRVLLDIALPRSRRTILFYLLFVYAYWPTRGIARIVYAVTTDPSELESKVGGKCAASWRAVTQLLVVGLQRALSCFKRQSALSTYLQLTESPNLIPEPPSNDEYDRQGGSPLRCDCWLWIARLGSTRTSTIAWQLPSMLV